MEMAAKEGGQPRYKGESYQFVVDVPSTLLCNVCLELCSDPQQAVCCGKLFCLNCIEKVKTINKDKNCPCCRQAIKTFPDKRTEQEIGNLQIICPNIERGCQERPELRNVGEHKNVCPFELIPCQFSDVGCLETMLRKDSKDHNRKEIIQHLDLCRRRIARLEEVQRKIPPDIKETKEKRRQEDVIISCQPDQVIQIEVNHHDRIIKSYSAFCWISDPFHLDNWEIWFNIDFYQKSQYVEHILSLQMVELQPSRTVKDSRIRVNGECEVIVKEDYRIKRLNPFQITFTRNQDNRWMADNCVGKIHAHSFYNEICSYQCVIYKLIIWKLAHINP